MINSGFSLFFADMTSASAPDRIQESLPPAMKAVNGFDPIKDIPNGVYLTGFFSNYPTAQTMADIYSFLDHHNLTPSIGAVYPFSHIAQALYDMDSHKIDGKIVIRVN